MVGVDRDITCEGTIHDRPDVALYPSTGTGEACDRYISPITRDRYGLKALPMLKLELMRPRLEEGSALWSVGVTCFPSGIYEFNRQGFDFNYERWKASSW